MGPARPQPRRRRGAALVTVGLLAVVTSCGDDDGPTTTPQEDANDLDTQLEELLLTADDLPGWRVERRPPGAAAPSDDEDACGAQLDSVASPQAQVAVELMQEADPQEVRFVFQDVSAYADEAQAASTAEAFAEAFASCFPGQERQPGEFAVDDVAPLDVAAAGFQGRAWGWHLAFGPPLVEDPAITGMDFVLLQNGPTTTTVSLFVPAPADLDILQLAAVVDQRLAAQ